MLIIGVVALAVVILGIVAYVRKYSQTTPAPLVQEGETMGVNLVGILVENDPATARVGYSLAGDGWTINLDLSLFKRELVTSYLGKKVVISGDQRRERLTRQGVQDPEPTDFVSVTEIKLAE